MKKEKIIAVLGYHKIGDPPPEGWHTWNYVSEILFTEHLEYLEQENWNVISDKEFLKALKHPDDYQGKSVLITFDDGYKTNLEIALPILNEHNYPAVVFVPTQFVGGYNSFDSDIHYEPLETICDWQELSVLEKSGVSIQSHGVSHQHFSKLSARQKKQEAVLSKQVIDINLKKQVRLFSFPYGDDGEDQIETSTILKDAGYQAAFIYKGGILNLNNSSNFRLPRIPVGADTNLKTTLETFL